MCVRVCVVSQHLPLRPTSHTSFPQRKAEQWSTDPKLRGRCIKALFFPLLEGLTQPPQMFPAYLNCESETTMEILAWLDKV